MKKLKAFYKYLISFFKSNWTFDDYPVETWKNPNAQHDEIKYGAGIINWSSFISHGATPEEAIKNLKKDLAEYEENYKLPRPGIKAPLQFAKTDRIENYDEIGIDFFDKILGVDYFDHFVSDESILFDIDFEKENTVEKIKNEYGIEVTVEDLVVDIFEQINKKPVHNKGS